MDKKPIEVRARRTPRIAPHSMRPCVNRRLPRVSTPCARLPLLTPALCCCADRGCALSGPPRPPTPCHVVMASFPTQAPCFAQRRFLHPFLALGLVSSGCHSLFTAIAPHSMLSSCLP